MKPLPKEINKTKMIELYSDQMSKMRVLEEIKSFQEQLNTPPKVRMLDAQVKILFFKRFGLPTGYMIPDENKNLSYKEPE